MSAIHPSVRVREAFPAEIKVGPHGFVRFVDCMGDDSAIVQAARVSYGDGTKTVSEDRGLIRYLLRHRHTTPLEMAVIKFHIQMPIDVARQHIRHRMSSTNEYSTRYSVAMDEMAFTEPNAWRRQSTTNKQGSGALFDEITGEKLSQKEAEVMEAAKAFYLEAEAMGVAREQARKVLPVSNYTSFYWKIDLHNLLHYLGLRMDSHAQLEIRQFANAIGAITEAWCPIAWEAFEDYHPLRGASLLSRLDQDVLRALNTQGPTQAKAVAGSFGWLEAREDGSLKANRERTEFETKVQALGITAPWIN